MELTLEPVDSVEITILMDNLVDPLLVDEGGVRRSNWPRALAPAAPKLESSVTVTHVPEPLRAEPGFSALVTVRKGQASHTILFDAGVTPTGVVENLRRLDLSLKDVELIVLSHGHWDHVTGMQGVMDELGRDMPVLIHPEFWNRRRIRFPHMDPGELPSPSRSAMEGLGFEIVEERQPSFILDGAILVTGEVDRTSDFETGFVGHEVYRDSAWHPDPLILDDQAIVLRLRDQGLVIITGCGHAGVVNVTRYAQRLTGESRVAALMGGFHLSGPMFEPIIEPTVAAFEDLAPKLLMPAHCTGWRAVHRLADRFPDVFVQAAVGTTVKLESGAPELN